MIARTRQKRLDNLLSIWAEWESDINGYPGSTAETHAGEGVSPNKPGSRPPKGWAAPDHIRDVGSAIKTLGDFYPELGLVINIRYRLIDGRQRNSTEQLDEFCRTAKRGARTYHEWLGKAYAWLDGRLS